MLKIIYCFIGLFVFFYGNLNAQATKDSLLKTDTVRAAKPLKAKKKIAQPAKTR